MPDKKQEQDSDMQKKHWMYAIGGLVVGALLTWMVLGNNGTKLASLTSSQGSNNTMTSQSDDLDKDFIEQMVSHHTSAIEMAKMAQKRSQREEIKAFASNIIKAQSEEISQMSKWHKDWFGEDISNGMSMSGDVKSLMDETDKKSMSELENAPDFDKEFLKQMSSHHSMAVMLSELMVKGTTRQELKDLGNKIIADQSKEIKMISDWQMQWGY